MDKEFVTTDLALTAYIKMQSQIDTACKMKFKRFNKANGRKIEFIFDDPQEQADDMQVQFLNSPCKLFDSEIRDLKKIFHKREQ